LANNKEEESFDDGHEFWFQAGDQARDIKHIEQQKDDDWDKDVPKPSPDLL